MTVLALDIGGTKFAAARVTADGTLLARAERPLGPDPAVPAVKPAVTGAAMTATETRPWGRYRVLDESAVHKAEHIRVEPGRRLSYQRHRRRSEHWYVVVGPLHVTIDDDERILQAGESIDIPVGAAHRQVEGSTSRKHRFVITGGPCTEGRSPGGAHLRSRRLSPIPATGCRILEIKNAILHVPQQAGGRGGQR